MTTLIYTVLFIQMVFTNYAYTREVQMTNISEILGTDGIKLRCSYAKDLGDILFGVNFFAMNDSNVLEGIAESLVLAGTPPKILPYGEYLFGNASITKIGDLVSEEVLTFNDLKCKHERKYTCSMTVYFNSNHQRIFSQPTTILVKVLPLKPKQVVIIKTLLIVSPTHVSTSTSSHDENENSTIVKSLRNAHTTDTTLNNSNSSIDNNKTTFTTVSYTDHIDYNNAFSTNPTTVEPSIMEGDNITYQCSGNVGKPAAIFVFKKFRKHNSQFTKYDATTTAIEEIPGNCSYYRTSNLTFKVTAEDNQAVIRCVVVSHLADEEMYIESEQLEVQSATSTSSSSTTGSSSDTEKKSGNSTQKITYVIIGVCVVLIFVVLPIVGYCLLKRNKNDKEESPENNGSTNNLMPSNSKYMRESRPGAYDSVNLEGDAPVIASGKKEPNIDKNKSSTSHQPVIYAEVNKATQLKNRQETSNQQDDDTYAGTQEGIYDQSGNRRHKENENAEQFDKIGDIKEQNSTDDTASSVKSNQKGFYVNQALNKGEKQVATVPPISRSSAGSQGYEQTSELSQKGFENVEGTDNTHSSTGQSIDQTSF